MSGFVIKTEQQIGATDKAIHTAVNILTLYTAAVSFWYAFFSVFQIPAEPAVLYVSLLIPALIWPLVFRRKRRRKTAVLLTVIACVICGLLMRRYAADGFRQLVNSYIVLHNEFYSASRPLLDAADSMEGVMTAVILIQMLLTALQAAALRARRGIFAAVPVILLPFLLSATVGYMPSAPSGWLVIGAALLYVLVYAQTDMKLLKREVLTAACVYGAVIMAASLIQTSIIKFRDANHEEYVSIHDRLVEGQKIDLGSILAEKFRGNTNYSVGGIGKGDLRSLAENRPQGTKDLELILSEAPEERVYLKAYVGAEYTGKRWKEPSGSGFDRMLRTEGAAGQGAALFGEPYRRIEEGQDSLTPLKMQMKLIGASDEFAYSPYFSRVTDDDSVFADAYIRGRGKKERTYSFFPRYQVEFLQRGSWGEETKIWQAYEDYVESAYTEKAEGLERLEEYCSELDTRSLHAVTLSIDARFNRELQYTKEPGAYPADTDFAEYFLTESRRGFCVHFATAAALIYRECGYPSRYVEGYAVPPSAFERQEDGTYKAVVTDGMAHAWCETFQSDIGWQVQEHTLPFAEDQNWLTEPADTGKRQETEPEDIQTNSTQPQAEEPQPQADPPQQVQEPEEAKETENKERDKSPVLPGGEGGSGEGGSQGAGIKVLLKMAVGGGIALAVIASALLLCIIQQKIRMQRKKYQFRQKEQNRGIKSIFRAIYNIALFEGLNDKGMNDREALRQLELRYPDLTSEEWSWLYDCALRAAFAEGQLERGEQQKMYELYKKFRRSVLSVLTAKQKFVFLFVKGL